jgi:hypothetical protein
MRYVVPVTHAKLVGVRWAHTIAAVIEDATSQNGWRTLESDLPPDGIGDELGLHRLEQLSLENRLMLATMSRASIDHLADVEPVLEQMSEGTYAEPDTAPYISISKAIRDKAQASGLHAARRHPPGHFAVFLALRRLSLSACLMARWLCLRFRRVALVVMVRVPF